jgi:hypothetical protein
MKIMSRRKYWLVRVFNPCVYATHRASNEQAMRRFIRAHLKPPKLVIVDEPPTPEDWMNVSNDLSVVLNDVNRALGLPERYAICTRPWGIPSDELLAQWDAVCPGAAERLRRNALMQMRHRKRMEAITRWTFGLM